MAFQVYILHNNQSMRERGPATEIDSPRKHSNDPESHHPSSFSSISAFELKNSGKSYHVDPSSLQIEEGRGEEGSGVDQWSDQDEAKLLLLHNEWGNRWVEIGQQLNRTDNTVKNHYYSRLRRGLRIINRLIARGYHHKWRQLNHNVVSKVVQAAQQLYRPRPQHPEQTKKAFKIKNQLLEYGKPQSCEWSPQGSQQIIEELIMFNRNYRKRCKHPQNQGLATGCEFKAKEMKTLIQQNQLHSVTIPRRLRNDKDRSSSEEEHPKTVSVKEEEQLHLVRQGEPQVELREDKVERPVKQEQPQFMGALLTRSMPVLPPNEQAETIQPVLGHYWSYPSPQFCLVSPYVPMLYVNPFLTAGREGSCTSGGLRGQTAPSIPDS